MKESKFCLARKVRRVDGHSGDRVRLYVNDGAAIALSKAQTSYRCRAKSKHG